jgi:hypothetical protein
MKSLLIHSIMSGHPIPLIYLHKTPCEDEDYVEEVRTYIYYTNRVGP